MPPKTNRTTARVCVSSLPNETIDADEKQRRDAETPRSRLRSHYEVTSVEKAAVPARGQGIAVCSRVEKPGLPGFTAARGKR